MNTRQGFFVKLAKTCPTLQYMSLGLLLAWMRLAFGGATWVSPSVDITNELTLLPFYTYSGTAFSLILLAFAAAPAGPRKMADKAAFPLAGGAIAAFGALVIILCGPCVFGLHMGVFATYTAYAGYAITGVGMAFIALRCGQLYGRLQPRAVIMQMALAVLLMVAVYFVTTGAPSPRINGEGPMYVGAFSFVVLPLIAGLFAMLPSFAGASGTNSVVYTEDRGGIPVGFWKILLVVTILSMISAVVNAYLTAMSSVGQVITDSGVTMLFWGVVAVAFACLAIGLQADRFHFGRMYSLVMAVSALSIALIPLSDFLSFNWGYLTSFASCVFDFVFRCILAFIVFQKRLSPVMVFGYGLGGHMLGSVVGWTLGYKMFPVLVSESGTAPFFVMALVALMAVFVLFSEKDFDKTFEETEGEDEKSLSHLMEKGVHVHQADPAIAQHSPRGKFRIAVDLVADEHGLSRREKEVLQYLAMGYESNTIAEKMGVSWNTVRTHTRNLYGKLDVHSKQDAVALVDAMVNEVSA